MKYFFSYVCTVVVLVGCQSTTTTEPTQESSQAQQIYAEAMKIHDEIMPRMGEIMRLRQKLQLRVESLKEEDSAQYADSLQKIEAAIQDLQEADAAMMQWMRGVKEVPGTDNLQSEYQDDLETQLADTVNLVQIQQEQKESIVSIKEQIEASIEQAQLLVGLPE